MEPYGIPLSRCSTVADPRTVLTGGHRSHRVHFSFDHDNTTLIERLIAMEAAEIAGLSGVSLKRVREAFETRQRNEPKLETRLAGTEVGVEAVQELREYRRPGRWARMGAASAVRSDLAQSFTSQPLSVLQ
jgi:hypothetical protein